MTEKFKHTYFKHEINSRPKEIVGLKNSILLRNKCLISKRRSDVSDIVF